MAAYIASIAEHVANSADAVARSVAPLHTDGASSTKTRITGPVGRTATLLEQSMLNVANIAKNGLTLHSSDIPALLDAVRSLGCAGLDDRKLLLPKILVIMSRAPTDSEFMKNLQIAVIEMLYKDLPHPPAGYLPSPNTSSHQNTKPSKPTIAYSSHDTETIEDGYASPAAQDGYGEATTGNASSTQPYLHPSYGASVPYAFRSADGKGYNKLFPDIGAAGRPYARSVPSTTPIAPWALPDPAVVFDALLARRPTPSPPPPLKRHPQVLPSSSPKAIPGHTTLPPTDADGFAPHPGGVSSLFFAFADLVIHCCFNTSHSQWAINNASSYLDLSPLYGSGSVAGENEKVRRKDGTGRLWEDVFADARLLFMPPNVCALLVLFCRNHNYIAEKLLLINERGSYTPFEKLPELRDADRLRQDDELYNRARLVNCGWFMQIILGDYVGAILGLARDGLSWRLNPLVESRELDHSVSSRGGGNVVSVEFNLLYRWHAGLSKNDTAWTEKVFEGLFGTSDFKSITADQFQKTLAQKIRPDPDVKVWTFEGVDGKRLTRDAETGAFRSEDLAAILQQATWSGASALKARGIPEVLRVVEIMGIEQSRQWGTCTMNEFRKFMGLKQFGTFKEWNSDPEVHKTAEMLYGHIDNLELHVGLQAEEASSPIPGTGLCLGYTMSRAILSDAVALVRGDRFLTTDFTVYNLSSWGYQDCFAQENDGSYGGMLTRLLFRTLPSYYPAGSSYAHFPFMVPQTMRGYLEKLVPSPAAKYTFTRPQVPSPDKVVTSFKGVREVLSLKTEFESTYAKRLASLTKGVDVNVFAISDTFHYFKTQGQYGNQLGLITERLLEEKCIAPPGSMFKYVDIVKHVTNLIPVYFIATEIAGLPIKTEKTPRGKFLDTELAEMFAGVCNYLITNTDPYMDWVLREKSVKTANFVVETIEEHMRRLSGRNIIGKVTDSLLQWYTGENSSSDLFLSKVLTYDQNKSILANSVFASAVSTAALYSKAITHVVDFFLDSSQTVALSEVVQLAYINTPESNNKLYKYAREALRLNPATSSVMRMAKPEFILNKGNLGAYQPVYCSIVEANLDTSVFGKEPSVPVFSRTEEGILGLDSLGLTNQDFFKASVPHVLRAIFKLKNLRRAPGSSGTLSRIVEMKHGCPEVKYLDQKNRTTPFPVSMFVQYDV